MGRRFLVAEAVCIAVSLLLNTESGIGYAQALVIGVIVGVFVWIFGEVIR